MSKKEKSGGDVLGREAKELKRKVLLIGESPDIQLFTALQQEGYDVVACESARKAWGLVHQFRPHCIVVYLHHLSRSDVAVLQECRAMAKGVRIIIATSDGVHERVMKVLEDRVTSFLSLPAKPQAVRKLLDELEPSAAET